ncbi:hypothetical protein CDL15_Pgr008325 [Punica granatum]|uniref:Uncharacterized protein n=1 Tax=Punica granatum TaxID=22663 RepID=A0A218XTD4_PUNGR|nr:hypothetical protein CDL15_Pgr008325 [Punica granatum]PKI77696.1 hypothetical protein CRG98_001926 [Punica granatum]
MPGRVHGQARRQVGARGRTRTGALVVNERPGCGLACTCMHAWGDVRGIRAGARAHTVTGAGTFAQTSMHADRRTLVMPSVWRWKLVTGALFT